MKKKILIICIISILLVNTFAYTQNANDYEFSIVDNIEDMPKCIVIDRFIGQSVGTRITVPSSINGIPVVAIGEGAFADLLVYEIVFTEGLLYIFDVAFAYCTNLNKITFPKSLEIIGQSAFMACMNLREINIPDGSNLTEIHPGAFSGCVYLENIILPNNLNYLGMGAFLGCTNLRNIRLPDGLTEISERVFEYCENLRNITIPSGLQKIGRGAFRYTALNPQLRALMESKFGVEIW